MNSAIWFSIYHHISILLLSVAVFTTTWWWVCTQYWLDWQHCYASESNILQDVQVFEKGWWLFLHKLTTFSNYNVKVLLLRPQVPMLYWHWTTVLESAVHKFETVCLVTVSITRSDTLVFFWCILFQIQYHIPFLDSIIQVFQVPIITPPQTTSGLCATVLWHHLILTELWLSLSSWKELKGGMPQGS